ncbi:hypothetical protein ML401_38845 [Bradyrhizobium sp. 62B]|jgi:hypothetical protein|nr:MULTISPECIES: hypothetical protein [Bradyrhizobium]MDT4740836.1 hypothetical protein [Bradyrhizobium sp. WYCCWR 12699]WPM83734.1 hypothetical protein ML401_38845 [Bradyrhizobium sp. 62B]
MNWYEPLVRVIARKIDEIDLANWQGECYKAGITARFLAVIGD